ncbi:guanine deaminase [Fulvimarina sp. 2208YS6-2-32]|uniref:Guanine deaminase n=1 Tax=Fulvimarina uroteuthidis TaxID=3098149 RepID=A0ABU5I1D3_9HYPH|nr:guanine deaminase [Fulvimarina sp. 2208YS6-2-32]MDY8108624.1 guanine deaminase [Fulvimarina sp. 2208YS6-2-32]
MSIPITPVASKGRTLALRGRVLSFAGDPAQEGERAVRFHSDGLVLVRDGLIEAVGEAQAMLDALQPGFPVVNHHPHLIMAGFIDPHLHLPQTQVIASYGAELLEWLQRYTFPEETRYSSPRVASDASRWLLDTLAANGTTSGSVYCTTHPASVDAFLGEAGRRGLRMLAGKVMMDRGAPDALIDTPQRAHDETKAAIERWHGEGRLEVAITPRFAPTSSEAQLEVAGALARDYPDLPIQTHLSENAAELDYVAQLFPHDADYTAVYERFGLVRPRALLGHCIHLNLRERRALGEGGASAIFCPTSNLFLGSGLFDRNALGAAGVRIGIATDIGGGTSYSMLRTLAEGYKVLALRGQKLPAFEAFHLASAGNAQAMGLSHVVGTLAPGLEADITVLDSRATRPLVRRMERVETLEEELFALMTLGDERATVATYSGGRAIYERADAPPERGSPARQNSAPLTSPGDGRGGSDQ